MNSVSAISCGHFLFSAFINSACHVSLLLDQNVLPASPSHLSLSNQGTRQCFEWYLSHHRSKWNSALCHTASQRVIQWDTDSVLLASREPLGLLSPAWNTELWGFRSWRSTSLMWVWVETERRGLFLVFIQGCCHWGLGCSYQSLIQSPYPGKRFPIARMYLSLHSQWANPLLGRVTLSHLTSACHLAFLFLFCTWHNTIVPNECYVTCSLNNFWLGITFP
jgi:hypothetical protein